MKASLVTLLDGILDYAGVFPPATLEMPDAFSRYLTYIRGNDEWFLGRFVCPAAHLEELLEVIDRTPGAPEIPLAVVGRPSADYDEWAEGLEQDAQEMNAFVKAAGDSAVIEAFEVKLPGHEHIAPCIRDLKAFQEVDVFVELPWGQGMDDSLAALAETEWLAAKARTGGENIPSAGTLAGFIHGAVALDVSFKLTAGLHNPLPRLDRQTGALEHGFLNALTACGLAFAHDLSRVELEAVLQARSIEDWKFDDKRMTFQGHVLDNGDLEDIRDIFWSIGSCSFEEALTGLDALGLVAGGR